MIVKLLPLLIWNEKKTIVCISSMILMKIDLLCVLLPRVDLTRNTWFQNFHKSGYLSFHLLYLKFCLDSKPKESLEMNFE